MDHLPHDPHDRRGLAKVVRRAGPGMAAGPGGARGAHRRRRTAHDRQARPRTTASTTATPARRTPRLDRGRPRAFALAAVATALLWLAGCDRGADAPAACALPDGATVLAIGDSLTRGFGADGDGYAEQLQALLDGPGGRAGVSVRNLGIDGERSAGLLARIDGALGEHRPAAVLITTGGNDFLRRVDEAETRRHLWAVVDRVRAQGALPVVFGIPRPSLGAAVGLADEHDLYADLADEGRASVIAGVVPEVLSSDALKSDRIHPNRDGYGRMARAAFDVLSRCR